MLTLGDLDNELLGKVSTTPKAVSHRTTYNLKRKKHQNCKNKLYYKQHCNHSYLSSPELCLFLSRSKFFRSLIKGISTTISLL